MVSSPSISCRPNDARRLVSRQRRLLSLYSQSRWRSKLSLLHRGMSLSPSIRWVSSSIFPTARMPHWRYFQKYKIIVMRSRLATGGWCYSKMNPSRRCRGDRGRTVMMIIQICSYTDHKWIILHWAMQKQKCYSCMSSDIHCYFKRINDSTLP